MQDRQELNPADAMRLGGDLFLASRWEEAEQIFRAVSAAEPGNHHAASVVGVCLTEQGKSAQALDWFDKAGMLLRDEMIAVSCNRAKALAELSRADEALQILNGILQMTGGQHTIALYNRGLVLLQKGEHKAAIADMDAVLAREPGNDKARFGRGFANLVLGNYLEGFRDYECRLKDDVPLPDAPVWDGSQDIAGKTVLVYGEQGLGDNIMFARYLPMMVERGARVFFFTPPVIRPLLGHIKGVRLLFSGDPWPHFDYWTWSMSLAHCFRTTAETVPPPVGLTLDTVEMAEWHTLLRRGPGLKIGLCWTGAKHSRYDEHRSIALEKLAPLFELDAVFYSLQKDVRESDRAAFRRFPIVDLAPHMDTFQDTAEIMSCLDLVITVDTSVAHLAGTVGVPTWIMLTAFRTYWLWIEKRETSPWYPSVRLFRQSTDGDWAGVVAQVRAELANRAAKAA